MNNISEVVFEVTANGFSVLRGGGQSISLQHKTVLTLVDGICPVAQYVPFLLAFAPLEEKFQTLERLGLIRRIGSVSDAAIDAFHASAQSGMVASKLPRIDSQSKSSGFAPLYPGD
jgi:hypothetical protein